MPFGEYELSPSLIGLSLLHSAHPEAFQRLLVRTSIPCYRDFILAKCRSLGFASAPTDYNYALFRLAFTAARVLNTLTSPVMATRRFIMQKARRHTQSVLRPLVGARFQELFHSPNSECFSPFPHGTGTLSVSQEYLALPDGPGRFAQDFSCPALLRITLGLIVLRIRDCHPL